MSLTEISNEIAQLSIEDRRKLQEQLALLESVTDPAVMARWTASNRAALSGQVHTREEMIAAMEKAGTKLT